MNDETTFLPKVREATGEEKLAEARNRGMTIGLLIMFGLFAACAAGTAIGAFLTRVLVM